MQDTECKKTHTHINKCKILNTGKYTTYSCMINHWILLLVLTVIDVLYDFVVMLGVFDGLMMVEWTGETGNRFNNVVL
jgi:hypothetical protein